MFEGGRCSLSRGTILSHGEDLFQSRGSGVTRKARGNLDHRAGSFTLHVGIIEHRLRQLERLGPRNPSQAGQHQPLLLGAGTGGKDGPERLKPLRVGKLDRFFVCRQTHASANRQGAEVLLGGSAGQLEQIGQKLPVSGVAQRADGGGANLLVSVGDGSAQGRADPRLVECGAHRQQGNTRLSPEGFRGCQSLHQWFHVQLAAPGLNVLAGGIERLRRLGASGLVLCLGNKLHQPRQLPLIY